MPVNRLQIIPERGPATTAAAMPHSCRWPAEGPRTCLATERKWNHRCTRMHADDPCGVRRRWRNVGCPGVGGRRSAHAQRHAGAFRLLVHCAVRMQRNPPTGPITIMNRYLRQAGQRYRSRPRRPYREQRPQPSAQQSAPLREGQAPARSQKPVPAIRLRAY